MSAPFNVGDTVELIDVTFRGEPVQRKVESVGNGCVRLDVRLPWDAKMIASVVDNEAVRFVLTPRPAYAPGQVWADAVGTQRKIVACGTWGVAYRLRDDFLLVRTPFEFDRVAVTLVRTEDAE